MSLNLTNILQNPSQTNQIQAGPNASRQTGVVLEDSASVTWSTDGFGNIQAAAGVSSPSGMTLIQTQTLSAPAETVTFSAIPQTFTHLLIIASACDSSGTSQAFTLTFNGDTGTNYAYCNTLNVNGVPGGSASASSPSIPAGLEGGTGGASQISIPAYRGALPKTATGTANSFTAGAAVLAAQYGGNWNNVAAITSIELFANSSFTAGSVFSLYGIQ